VPPFSTLAPGRPVAGLPGSASFVVAEKDAAELRGLAGEIPYELRPGERSVYADLSGSDGAYATIDYGDGKITPTLYMGREVTLAELGWAERAPAEVAGTVVKAERMACPECDGALELRAPDQAKRVGCPYCGALSEVKPGGKLARLALLDGPRVASALPLGGKGVLRGLEWTVLAHLHKGTSVDGVWYAWDEYLLFRAGEGYRWLVCSDRHWSFVEPVPAGEVDVAGNAAFLRGLRYKLYQSGSARVRQVAGECYWKVELDETTRTRDYVAPPLMLSLEQDDTEVHWSLGTYLPAAEVARAFGVELPAPESVGANQPFPHNGVLRAWGVVLGLVLLLALGVFNTRGTRTLLERRIPLDELAAGAPLVWFSPEVIELAPSKNVEVQLSAPVSNAWVYVQGDLVNESTGLVQSFDAPLEYYFGSDGGESWSEGDRDRSVYLSALPAGGYTLRLEILGHVGAGAADHVQLSVRQGVPRWAHLGLLLFGLSIIPAIVLWRRMVFEKRRWEESDQGE
jgi:hypothetical protein